MKAWNVTDRNCDGYYCIVYAETRGKAIKTALDHTDGAFDDYTFTEIWATRAPSLDKFYRGKTVLEWDDPDDRIIMVREAGFYCGYEMLDTECDCEVCPAKQWCQRYERMKEAEHADGA